MSDTPETDALAVLWDEFMNGLAQGEPPTDWVNFARSLERRLQEAHGMSEPEEYRIRVDADAYEQMVSKADYDALELRLQAALREVAALQMALDAVVDAAKENDAVLLRIADALDKLVAAR